jgi:acetyl esterase/lipase
MKTMSLCWVSALFAAAAVSQADAQGAREKTFEEIVNAPLVLKKPGTERVKVTTQLRYHPGVDDPNLLMDVYSPLDVKAAERRPVLMFVHGGAGSESRPKDWGIYKGWGRLAGASGLVGVTFTHRLGYPKPLLAESGADVAAAIDYVRANAAKFGADPDRICLAAYSAGGPLLTLGYDAKRPYIRCLIAVYAFLDVQQSSLHRDHEPAERVKQYSMIEHLGDKRAREIPTLIARAGLDEIPTMNDSIDRFIARAIRENANVTVMNHPAGVHGFDNQNDDDRSREIMEFLLAFASRHLRLEN